MNAQIAAIVSIVLVGFMASGVAMAQPVPATQAEEAAQEFALGNTAKACKQYRTIAADNPTLVEAQYGTALCARTENNPAKAITILNSLLVSHPNYAPGHLLLADVLDGEGKTEEADEHYRMYGHLQKTTGLIGHPKSPQLRLRLRKLGVY